MKKVEVLDFYADWCFPCKSMFPVIGSLMEQYNVEGSNVSVKKIDIEKDKISAAKFGIRSIPTLVFLVDGEEKSRFTGAVPKEKILERINESLA